MAFCCPLSLPLYSNLGKGSLCSIAKKLLLCGRQSKNRFGIWVVSLYSVHSCLYISTFCVYYFLIPFKLGNCRATMYIKVWFGGFVKEESGHFLHSLCKIGTNINSQGRTIIGEKIILGTDLQILIRGWNQFCHL